MSMKANKRGKTGIKMLTVTCSMCGADMDCPESMLSADRHFCASCTELLAGGYEPEELRQRGQAG